MKKTFITTALMTALITAVLMAAGFSFEGLYRGKSN